MDPNIETFIGCDSSFEKARIVLFGAPFDSTTSFRPGARFGHDINFPACKFVSKSYVLAFSADCQAQLVVRYNNESFMCIFIISEDVYRDDSCRRQCVNNVFYRIF